MLTSERLWLPPGVPALTLGKHPPLHQCQRKKFLPINNKILIQHLQRGGETTKEEEAKAVSVVTKRSLLTLSQRKDGNPQSRLSWLRTVIARRKGERMKIQIMRECRLN